MDDKFQNKYRNTSTRLQNWDYGWNAPYFVTICTKNREHYFGKIVDGEMIFFGPQSQNLPSIIRGYKIGVKKYATMNNIDFGWQPRYNDHIIRDNQSFDRIQNYINTNIKNWKNDDFYE